LHGWWEVESLGYLPRVDSLRELVESLVHCRAPRPELFVDEVNYWYHVKFVLPRCGRLSTLILYVAPHYVVVDLVMHRYLYGVTSDSKVFVNKIAMAPRIAAKHLVTVEGRTVEVKTTTDYDVRLVLNYGDDYEKEEVVIRRTGRYRVQGDLVVEVDKIDVEGLIVDHMRSYQELLLADIIVRTLLSYRLSADVNRAIDRIVIPSYSGFYADKVARLLYRELSGSVVSSLVEIAERDSYRLEGGNDYGNCDIIVCSHGSNIIVDVMCKTPITGTLAEKLYREFSEIYKPTSFEIMVGNHHIRMEGVKSLNVRYRPSVQPVLMGDGVVEISEGGWYVVTPESRVTITHEEHGVTNIVFNGNYVIRFRTIALSAEHVLERNTVVLELLKV
jgi:hypothetical protein